MRQLAEMEAHFQVLADGVLSKFIPLSTENLGYVCVQFIVVLSTPIHSYSLAWIKSISILSSYIYRLVPPNYTV